MHLSGNLVSFLTVEFLKWSKTYFFGPLCSIVCLAGQLSEHCIVNAGR